MSGGKGSSYYGKELLSFHRHTSSATTPASKKFHKTGSISSYAMRVILRQARSPKMSGLV